MLDAENAVLGSILLDNSSIEEAIASGMERGYLGSIANKYIWGAFIDLSQRGEKIDVFTVSEAIKGGFSTKGECQAYLSSLVDALPDPGSISSYVGVVKAEAIRRRCYEAGHSIIKLSNSNTPIDELVESVREKIDYINKVSSHDRSLVSARDSVQALYDRITSEDKNKDTIKTGFTVLDLFLGGLRPGNFLVLAGRPGMGKTALAVNMAHIQTTRYGFRPAFFSMEMTDQEVMERMLSAETDIPITKIRYGALSTAEREEAKAACDRISQWPFWIDDTPGLDISSLTSKARRAKRLHGIDILYVDYLQLMEGGMAQSGNRVEEVSRISRGLKNLGKELNIPIVALSQLNRQVESRPGKRPQLSDLRESGSIEQDANFVALLFRPGMYEEIDTTGGRTELILAKNRSGPTGTVELVWKANTNQFQNP